MKMVSCKLTNRTATATWKTFATMMCLDWTKIILLRDKRHLQIILIWWRLVNYNFCEWFKGPLLLNLLIKIVLTISEILIWPHICMIPTQNITTLSLLLITICPKKKVKNLKINLKRNRKRKNEANLSQKPLWKEPAAHYLEKNKTHKRSRCTMKWRWW